MANDSIYLFIVCPVSKKGSITSININKCINKDLIANMGKTLLFSRKLTFSLVTLVSVTLVLLLNTVLKQNELYDVAVSLQQNVDQLNRLARKLESEVYKCKHEVGLILLESYRNPQIYIDPPVIYCCRALLSGSRSGLKIMGRCSKKA